MSEADDAIRQIERGKVTASSLESESLDFKQDSASLRETVGVVADACVCFANADGGVVILGLADSLTGSDALLGTAVDPSELRKAIHQRTNPPLLVQVEEKSAMGVRLLAVTVPPGVEVHSNSKGVSTRRVEDECHRMLPQQIARLSEERSGRDWSASASDQGMEHIDDTARDRLYELLSSSDKPSVKRLARLTLPELLTELNLLADGSRLTQAASRLLARAVPGGPEVLVYQHRKTPSGETDFSRRWSGPILPALAECLETISVRVNSQPVTTAQGQQILLEDVPLAATREALVNALVHGDFRSGEPVQIEHSPSHFSILSPGPLVAGVTPKNILTNGSRPRFKRLVEAVAVLGLAEQLGQGVDRMFRAMVSSGRQTPTVTVRSEGIGSTEISLRGGPPNVRLARFVADLPPEERDDTDALLITLMLCEKKSVTAQTISPVIQRKIDQSEEVLRRLAFGEAEMIEATPGTAARRHPNYRLRSTALRVLGPAVTYHRRSISETDEKVCAHVREYDTINSATVQRTFDIDVYQARDLLRSLVDRGILIRVSSQTRGPYVKYGPGSQFPRRARR